MTQAQKTVVGLISLLLVVFAGTIFITVSNERHFFVRQMNSNAQDTATSLGLALSISGGNKDKAMMLAMVEAVFDRGYFSVIEVRDSKGDLLVSRYSPKQIRHAPEWFFELMQWPATLQSANFMNGWHQVGEVLVSSDSGYACDALWNGVYQLICWYLVVVMITLAVTFVFQRINKGARLKEKKWDGVLPRY